LLGERRDVLTTRADFTVKLDGDLISLGVPQITSSLELYAKMVDGQTNEDVSPLTEITRKSADVSFSLTAIPQDLYDVAVALKSGKLSDAEKILPVGQALVRVADPPIAVTLSAPLRAGGHYRLEIGARCRAEFIAYILGGVAFCDFSESVAGNIVVSPINITVPEQKLDAGDLINIITGPLLMDDDESDADKK
jgi:hypothetical protein